MLMKLKRVLCVLMCAHAHKKLNIEEKIVLITSDRTSMNEDGGGGWGVGGPSRTSEAFSGFLGRKKLLSDLLALNSTPFD